MRIFARVGSIGKDRKVLIQLRDDRYNWKRVCYLDIPHGRKIPITLDVVEIEFTKVLNDITVVDPVYLGISLEPESVCTISQIRLRE